MFYINLYTQNNTSNYEFMRIRFSIVNLGIYSFTRNISKINVRLWQMFLFSISRDQKHTEE